LALQLALHAHGAMMLSIASTASRSLFPLKSEGKRRKDAAPQEN
jgi:hypothetical protein